VRKRILSVLVAGPLLVAAAGSHVACRSRAAPPNPIASRAATSTASVIGSAHPAGVASAAPPHDFVRALVVGAPSVGTGHAVLLVDEEQRRGIPIFVSGTEGLSIELRLAKQRYKRPLTHDLFERALTELDARVHSARVVELRDGVYIGILVLVGKDQLHELDSRASDAIAMALGSGAPVFVSKKVFEQAGIPLDAIPDGGPSKPEEPRNIAL
jgi:bifunctional DNase/RNase